MASRAPISAATSIIFSTILGFEKFRAGQFGIRHYCCIGLNPKEANNEALAEAVLEVLPHFAVKESVVALGELGYDEQTPQEDKCLRPQIDLAKELDLPIMIHTPHRDKHRGTLADHGRARGARFDPARCVMDHNNEETVREVLDRGYFAGFSIYPAHQDGQRAADRDRASLRAGADHREFGLRLGRVRSSRGAEDRGAHGRARHFRATRSGR